MIRKNRKNRNQTLITYNLLDAEQFHFENEGAACGDVAYRTLAVSQIVGNDEAVFGAHLHQLQTFIPTLDYLMSTYHEGERLVAVEATVELLAVDEGAGVVHLYGLSHLGFLAVAFLKALVLQAALGGEDRLVVGVLLHIGLAFGDGVAHLAGLALIKLLLEALQQHLHLRNAESEVAALHVHHALGCGVAVDAKFVVGPRSEDILTDGVGSGVVEGAERNALATKLFRFIQLFAATDNLLLEGSVLLLHFLHLSHECVVVFLRHGHLALLHGDVVVALRHGSGAEGEERY